MKVQQKHIELVGMYEVAKMFGVSKQVISNWRTRHDDFPEPLATLAMGSIFSRNDLRRWGRSNGKLKD
jgi:chromosome partitioning protein